MRFENEQKLNTIEIEGVQFDYDDKGFVEFGEVAISLLDQQCQYASRYADGTGKDDPNLGKGLRFQGDSSDYHFMRIHKDDIIEFVKRVRDYRENR